MTANTTLITDEMIDAALEAANGVLIDTRRFWTNEDKEAVRAMLQAVVGPQSAFLRQYPNVIHSSLHDTCDQQILKLERELSHADAAGYARAIEDGAMRADEHAGWLLREIGGKGPTVAEQKQAATALAIGRAIRALPDAKGQTKEDK